MKYYTVADLQSVAIEIFGAMNSSQLEWTNSEGLPIQGDQLPCYHLCNDGGFSFDVRVYVDETIGCERCGKQYEGISV